MNADPDQAPTVAEGAILKALGTGPFSSGDLASRLKLERPRVTAVLQGLATRGLVHQQGTGPRNYRWHLGAKVAGRPTPAKEAP